MLSFKRPRRRTACLLAEVLDELPMVPGSSLNGPIYGLVARHAILGRTIVDLASASRLSGADGQRGHDLRVNPLQFACQSSPRFVGGFLSITDRMSVRNPSRTAAPTPRRSAAKISEQKGRSFIRFDGNTRGPVSVWESPNARTRRDPRVEKIPRMPRAL